MGASASFLLLVVLVTVNTTDGSSDCSQAKSSDGRGGPIPKGDDATSAGRVDRLLISWILL